ncbi:MAG: DNA-binding protein [Candidatus Parabeggiatoa sp. nov. 2]|nr:MAG: DNA-binding protein [Beggiatoa sp. 4572_84]RKZ57950.1 MAG: DNA-binding protein [Gammaproteobacteria bacterium]
MNDKRFFDSNIVVYLYSQDEPDKQSIAKKLFRNNQPIISTQVLGELANVLRRKFQMEYTDIVAAITQITDVSQVATITSDNIVSALNLANKYHYSFYDSLIIAVALAENCTILYTEDLQHGQVIESTLTIQNPFLADEDKKQA